MRDRISTFIGDSNKQRKGAQNNLFVKFVPWNENTFLSLKYKTIKFSTVYELNDYNEFNYIASSAIKVYNINRENIQQVVKDLFSDYSGRYRLLKNLSMARYTSKFVEDFKREFQNFEQFLKKFNDSLDQNGLSWIRCLIENIAYSSVGIFSCSNINIFNTEWAQLLYAYYADSFKGLVLLYQQEEESEEKQAKPITYKTSLTCFQNEIGALAWAQNHFEKMDSFNQKLDIWRHEQELRIFGSPGIRKASDFGVDLKTVFYTQRIQDDLCKIHEAVSDSVKVIEIHPGYGSRAHLFKFLGDDRGREGDLSSKWIAKNFLPQ